MLDGIPDFGSTSQIYKIRQSNTSQVISINVWESRIILRESGRIVENWFEEENAAWWDSQGWLVNYAATELSSKSRILVFDYDFDKILFGEKPRQLRAVSTRLLELLKMLRKDEIVSLVMRRLTGTKRLTG